MARQEISETAKTSAPADVVYAMLRDGSTWPRWSSIDAFELERPAADEPEGVGAVRVFRTGKYTMREQIVELRPERRFSYALLSGLPIRGYRADVDLEPNGDGTTISWRSSFTPRLPGTGRLIRRRLAEVTAAFVADLARAAASEKA
jgi:Polyketide cyclase / dehydrase and lipid transport